MYLEFDKGEGACISIELKVFSIFVTFDICPETQQAVHGGCVSFCEYTQQWKEKWKV